MLDGFVMVGPVHGNGLGTYPSGRGFGGSGFGGGSFCMGSNCPSGATVLPPR